MLPAAGAVSLTPTLFLLKFLFLLLKPLTELPQFQVFSHQIFLSLGQPIQLLLVQRDLLLHHPGGVAAKFLPLFGQSLALVSAIVQETAKIPISITK